METRLQAEERVLSTLNKDGSRRWMKPRLSTGRYWKARRITAYVLILIFTALPYVNINGKPAILLDIIAREFTFFGKTLFATDTLLLALFMMTVFVAVFLATALAGRVWCGWACPQTVYMEFVYRPVERFFDGKPGTRPKPGATGIRKLLKYLTYVAISAILAHTFLAYFVGVENLRHWVFDSPAKHPVAFAVMLLTTGLMLFDFGLFREQTCIVACPYGRFQSVMLDRSSLIVGYDKKRGEPRGAIKRKVRNGDVSLNVVEASQGDCIDCKMCVTTCPTGIDIRDGLQLECIHCAQCIDACDAVMDKVGRPRGLIRYSSQETLDGQPRRLLRPRVILYPLLLMVLVSVFLAVLLTRSSAEVRMIREAGSLFNVLPEGQIMNQARLRVTNRSAEPVTYSAQVIAPARGVGIELVPSEITLQPNKMDSMMARVIAEPAVFTTSPVDITVRVHGSDGFEKELHFPLHGRIWHGGTP
ncbi:MAG: cytochrome c oxidase accessory protein CcoG [Leptolyngbya sp. PLA3]|nr:MAG: cytochrome c oxidase accessory protein CcoG [Cyanobacteria bacterium CYA]MCE7968823.1 cytochrome c oxidase accessory protein CcoG [Leptolyngbya sp. PL-A3]